MRSQRWLLLAGPIALIAVSVPFLFGQMNDPIRSPDIGHLCPEVRVGVTREAPASIAT